MKNNDFKETETPKDLKIKDIHKSVKDLGMTFIVFNFYFQKLIYNCFLIKQ